MVKRTLLGGVDRVINIQGGVLRANRETGADDPVIAIRAATSEYPDPRDNPVTLTVRQVEILAYHAVSGDRLCSVEHHSDHPLADTDGRGVVAIYTDAPLVVVTDD